MRYMGVILRGLESTNIAKAVIGTQRVSRFNWNDKTKRNVIVRWMEQLFTLFAKNPSEVPYREPVLFSLADQVCIRDKGHLLQFFDDFQNVPTSLLIGLGGPRTEILQSKVRFLATTIRQTEHISQSFFTQARLDLEDVASRPNTRTFFVKVREFHPRKLIGKHSWNEVQAGSVEALSTEELLKTIEIDPILGSRFFLPGDSALATGISILAGHHRIYELYRRYINGMLQHLCIDGRCNGEILIRFVEKW